MELADVGVCSVGVSTVDKLQHAAALFSLALKADVVSVLRVGKYIMFQIRADFTFTLPDSSYMY